MPRIDDIKVQEKVFKKKEYRSWDGNLLEKLKLTDLSDQTSPRKISALDRQASINTESQKLETNQLNDNRVQSEFNSGSIKARQEFDQGSNGVQQELNQGSNEVQLGPAKSSNTVQLDANREAQLGFITDRAIVQKLISKLGGNEKKIFFYIIHICSIKGTLSTGEILGNQLTNVVSTTRNGRETAIKRLSKKGLLHREKGKTGANGTLCLHVTELIKTEALDYLNTSISEEALLSNWANNRVQIFGVNKVQLESGFPLYSSSNINTTTTNLKKLSEEWAMIDIEPLSEIGFTTTHLSQIEQQGKSSAEVVQDSIYAFAFDLKYNKKSATIKGPLLNFFMGIVRNGRPYAPSENYESPQDMEMRLYLQRKKDIEKARIEREDEMRKLAFKDWERELTEEDKQSILPDDLRLGRSLGHKQAALSIYFTKEIWPKRRQEIEREMSELGLK